MKQAPASLPSATPRQSPPPLIPLSRRRRALEGLGVPLAGAIDGQTLSLTLPVPPSINHHYATVNGRRVLSAAGRTFKAAVAQQVMVTLARAGRQAGWRAAVADRDLTLTIRFFFTSPLRRDVDGGLKITQDALCEALGLNDNCIVEIHLFKERDAANPRMEVSLRALSH